MQGFCDGIQLLKLYNKLISRLVDAEPPGTSHNNKAAGLIRHRRQRECSSAPLPLMASVTTDWKRLMMRKIKGLRWYMIGLVTVGTILGYLTRNTIAVAAPTLETQLGITTQPIFLYRRRLLRRATP